MVITEKIRIRLTPQRTVLQTDSETGQTTEIVNPTVIEDLDVLNPITQIVVEDPYAIAQGFEAKQPNSTGTKGDVSYNGGYYYICYNTNSWARIKVQTTNFSETTFNVYGETPTGAINSVNKSFNTSQLFILGTIQVYLNGLRQKKGVDYDYVEIDTNTIEFNTAPRTGSQILVDYNIV